MDLYIQVGVLLLFLTALALFIHFYTTPATMFSQGISEKNAEISERVAAIKDQDLIEALGNPNLSSAKALNLIKNSESKGLAVIVQTLNQQGLVVNYGHQLREPNANVGTIKPTGVSKGTSANSFESRFVTSACALFNSPTVQTQITVQKLNAFCAPSGTVETFVATNIAGNGTNYPIGSLNAYQQSGADATQAPHLMFSQATVSVGEASRKSETTSASGFLYTDHVLHTNQGTNTNFSHLENKNSVYYINRSSNFYSTLIKNSNDEIVGVYLEEHGVRDMGSYLRYAMKASGTIN